MAKYEERNQPSSKGQGIADAFRRQWSGLGRHVGEGDPAAGNQRGRANVYSTGARADIQDSKVRAQWGSHHHVINHQNRRQSTSCA